MMMNDDEQDRSRKRDQRSNITGKNKNITNNNKS